MLTEEQYLLICLMEECDEVSQRVAKALRFGLDEVQVGQDQTNRERLLGELDDLYTVAHELRFRQIVAQPAPNITKMQKIAKFMGYSREMGQLEAA
jgi:hypothetical protein